MRFWPVVYRAVVPEDLIFLVGGGIATESGELRVEEFGRDRAGERVDCSLLRGRERVGNETGGGAAEFLLAQSFGGELKLLDGLDGRSAAPRRCW